MTTPDPRDKLDSTLTPNYKPTLDLRRENCSFECVFTSEGESAIYRLLRSVEGQ